MPGLNIAAFTHRGRVREVNEDILSINDRIIAGNMAEPFVASNLQAPCVLMIADGMGGHVHGATASRGILDYLVVALDRLANPASCVEVIDEANQHLFSIMHERVETAGMGSTVVGAILKGYQLFIFNVGDSRCYLSSRGHLLQLSHDDVESNDRSSTHRSHGLTQALGGSLLPIRIEPHVAIEPPLAAGETLLLCSDGLTDMVPDNIIRAALNKYSDPAMAFRNLAARAFEAGAHDNLSLVVARPV